MHVYRKYICFHDSDFVGSFLLFFWVYFPYFGYSSHSSLVGVLRAQCLFNPKAINARTTSNMLTSTFFSHELSCHFDSSSFLSDWYFIEYEAQTNMMTRILCCTVIEFQKHHSCVQYIKWLKRLCNSMQHQQCRNWFLS